MQGSNPSTLCSYRLILKFGMASREDARLGTAWPHCSKGGRFSTEMKSFVADRSASVPMRVHDLEGGTQGVKFYGGSN